MVLNEQVCVRFSACIEAAVKEMLRGESADLGWLTLGVFLLAGNEEEHNRSSGAHRANELCRSFTCTEYEYL